MRTHILRCVIRALFIMFIVMTIVFYVVRLGPLDPAQYILGDYATAESLKNLRESMGLDRPIYIQYLNFLNRLIHGELGHSFFSQLSVLSQLLSVLPYTLELTIFGVLIGIFIGMPSGIIAALKPNTIFDQTIRVATLAGISIPIFVAGLFMILIFSLEFDLLPAIGGGTPGDIKSHLIHLILPAFTCGFLMMASVARLVRASLLDILGKDYVVTARSKGLRESTVILKHALRNALLPLITYLGIYINILLGSGMIVETIFTRPGVGRLIVESIRCGDFPVVQGCLMVYAGIVVLVNLLVDITYSFIDPRIVYK